MKKFLVVFLSCFAIFYMSSLVSFAQEDEIEVSQLTIVIDGKEKPQMDGSASSALVKDGRTFLPLRVLMTDLGIPDDDKHIIWNGQERSIKVIKDSTVISLQIDSKTVYINDKEDIIDAVPFIYKDTTYIPLRFVSQSLGKKVVWNEEYKMILIADEAKFNKTREALDNVKKSMEAVKFFSANVTAEFYGYEKRRESLDLKVNKEEKILAMNYEAETFSEDVYRLEKGEGICYNEKAYKKNYILNKWQEFDTNMAFEGILEQFADEGLLKLDDALCASLDMDVEDNEVKFTGSILLDNAMGDFSFVMFESPNYFEMIIDKNTNYVKSIKLLVEDLESENLGVVGTISFSQFNEMVKIDIPKESDIYVAEEIFDKGDYYQGNNLQKAITAYMVDSGDSELKYLGDEVNEIIVNLQKEIKINETLYGPYLMNPLGDKEPVAQSYKPSGKNTCWNIEIDSKRIVVIVSPSETDKLTINN
ncbi:copper amine oxidase N-terminal domain-containing protein [Acetivibrio cellulolyticus]|uniref:copper amine oxidase N-terminal domain-containing protein n=1 Tax=Acetivibrio cellulolyticus TaxID=35830 RepID=UPI0001E2BDF1|nr:copper amine oxidase N-terminal domain-containing protein [Acetivibrio cellulolyticus]